MEIEIKEITETEMLINLKEITSCTPVHENEVNVIDSVELIKSNDDMTTIADDLFIENLEDNTTD